MYFRPPCDTTELISWNNVQRPGFKIRSGVICEMHFRDLNLNKDHDTELIKHNNLFITLIKELLTVEWVFLIQTIKNISNFRNCCEGKHIFIKPVHV